MRDAGQSWAQLQVTDRYSHVMPPLREKPRR